MLVDILFVGVLAVVLIIGGILVIKAFRFPENYYENREKREQIIMKQMKQHEKNKQQ